MRSSSSGSSDFSQSQRCVQCEAAQALASFMATITITIERDGVEWQVTQFAHIPIVKNIHEAQEAASKSQPN